MCKAVVSKVLESASLNQKAKTEGGRTVALFNKVTNAGVSAREDRRRSSPMAQQYSWQHGSIADEADLKRRGWEYAQRLPYTCILKQLPQLLYLHCYKYKA